MKKNCKIITSYFGDRRRYPSNYKESVELFDKMIISEKLQKAGVEHDTIIVNHLTESKNVNDEVKEYLSLHNGKQTRNGSIIIMHRPWSNGEGFGFKSRQTAYDKYKDNYKYWFFVEDDFNFFYDDYYKNCVGILDEHENTAFVGTQWGEIACHSGIPKHCHGGMGCTHIKYLKKLVDYHGSLPYPTIAETKAGDWGEGEAHYRCAEMSGEVAFTNSFLKMGYDLRAILDQQDESFLAPISPSDTDWSARAIRRLEIYSKNPDSPDLEPCERLVDPLFQPADGTHYEGDSHSHLEARRSQSVFLPVPEDDGYPRDPAQLDIILPPPHIPHRAVKAAPPSEGYPQLVVQRSEEWELLSLPCSCGSGKKYKKCCYNNLRRQIG